MDKINQMLFLMANYY